MTSLRKAIAPILFAGNLAIILAMWWRVSGAEFGETVGIAFIAIGGLTGLVAFYLFLWQLLLIGRVGWIERPWGHDRLSRVHHTMGLVATAVLLAHPLLIIVGYSSLAQVTGIEQLRSFLTEYDYMLPALVAYLMVLGIVGMSLWIVRKRLRYELWYSVHIMLYLAIILSFAHQLSYGHHLAEPWARTYWSALFYATLATVAYYRLILPAWLFVRHEFRVTAVIPETHDVVSVLIGGNDLARLRAQAGQFVIVRFFAKGFAWESHPFSLSEVPNGERLRITVKAVGDFTKKLKDVPVGTRVWIEGPLGRFTAERAAQPRTLLIAGGIGITPLRALFEELAHKRQPVDLFYAARTDQDFALKKEIDTLVADNAHVRYVAADRDGHLTPAMIADAVPDVANRNVYLCGPPPMMKLLRQQLASLGVPKHAIIFEKFQLG